MVMLEGEGTCVLLALVYGGRGCWRKTQVKRVY